MDEHTVMMQGIILGTILIVLFIAGVIFLCNVF